MNSRIKKKIEAKELELLELQIKTQSVELSEIRKKKENSWAKNITLLTPLLAVIGLIVTVWQTNSQLSQQRSSSASKEYRENIEKVINYSNSKATVPELLAALKLPEEISESNMQDFGELIAHVMTNEISLQEERGRQFAYTMAQFSEPYRNYLMEHTDITAKLNYQLIEEYNYILDTKGNSQTMYLAQSYHYSKEEGVIKSLMLDELDDIIQWHWILFEKSLDTEQKKLPNWSLRASQLSHPALRSTMNYLKRRRLGIDVGLRLSREEGFYGNLSDCGKFKNGKLIRTVDGLISYAVLDRKDSIQYEYNYDSTTYIKSKITWRDECNYVLELIETNISDTLFIPYYPLEVEMERIFGEKYLFVQTDRMRNERYGTIDFYSQDLSKAIIRDTTFFKPMFTPYNGKEEWE